MQVNRIQSNNYNNQPNFGVLRITETGAKALRKAFNPEQIEQITKWGKDLESTKHFDLEISAVIDDLFYTFRHKTNPRLSSEAPLFPVSVDRNILNARGVDLIDCGDKFYYNNLQFPTAQEAGEAYSKLVAHESTCTPYPRKINSFDRLTWAVDSTKILDRATEHTGGGAIRVGYYPTSPIIREQKTVQAVQTVEETTKSSKPPFMQRLKNAWQALKGN